MPDTWKKGEIASVLIHSFSGFILAEGLDTGTAFRVERDGIIFDVQPLRRLSPPTWRPIPQFDENSFERFFPAINGKVQPMKLAVLPSIDENGKPALSVIAGDNISLDGLPLDTFTVVCSEDKIGRGEDISKEVVSDICAWLRVLTKQWWIGKPTEAITGNLHTVIGLKPGNIMNGLPTGRSSQVTPAENTKRVNQEIWREAIRRVQEGQSPKPFDEMQADANYYFFIRDYRTCIIIACSLFEILRDEALSKNGFSKRHLKSGDTDILRHLSVGFGEIFGHNLQQEKPSLYDFLKSCWIARGHVAHGKPFVWFKGGRRIPGKDLPLEQFSENMSKVADWITSMDKPIRKS